MILLSSYTTAVYSESCIQVTNNVGVEAAGPITIIPSLYVGTTFGHLLFISTLNKGTYSPFYCIFLTFTMYLLWSLSHVHEELLVITLYST